MFISHKQAVEDFSVTYLSSCGPATIATSQPSDGTTSTAELPMSRLSHLQVTCFRSHLQLTVLGLVVKIIFYEAAVFQPESISTIVVVIVQWLIFYRLKVN